jgi:hypothetical protein
MVTRLLITKDSIAIIFQTLHYWKIAFGEDEKKILQEDYPVLQTAVSEAKRLGFGGYWALPRDFGKKYRVRSSLVSILTKKVKINITPNMFGDEKNWRAIYQRRHANI